MEKVSRCDCHVHIFSPNEFPYAEARKFTPGEASIEALEKNLAGLGIERVVLVQPSVYGSDNSCLVHALQTLGSRARGVAVVSSVNSVDELELLSNSGVRGARLNLAVHGNESLDDALEHLRELELMIPASWHIQLHASLQVIVRLAGHISQSDRVYVVDHLGLPDPLQGIESELWLALLNMLTSGRVFVKLSGPYLVSYDAPNYKDLEPYIASLFATRKDRLLWGTNWPHTQGIARKRMQSLTDVEPFREIDDLFWKRMCESTAYGDILAENASRLYGFF